MVSVNYQFSSWEDVFHKGLPEPASVFWIIDKRVDELYRVSSRIQDTGVFLLSAWEEEKNLSTLEEIIGRMTENFVDRSTTVVAMGGGLTLDVAGFAASLYMRGISTIYIPTTLLAMVDASTGGKSGVNFKGYKNRLGSFHPPSRVIVDPSFLQTLNEEHLLSGWAEIMKHALIEGYPQWEKISMQAPGKVAPEGWAPIIRNSINIKKNIVQTDPYDRGPRQILNLGHTIGHAIESYYMRSGRGMSHGRAVAYGLVIEAMISNTMGVGTPEVQGVVCGAVEKQFGRLQAVSEPGFISGLMHFLKGDKKAKKSRPAFSLLRDIGEVEIQHYPDLSTIETALKSYFSGEA